MMTLGITLENKDRLLANMHEEKPKVKQQSMPDLNGDDSILEVIKRNPGCSKNFAKQRAGFRSQDTFDRLEKRGLIKIKKMGAGVTAKCSLYAVEEI